MSEEKIQNQPQTAQVEQKPNDKEYNFRQLEAKYQRQIEQERAARLEAERIAKEIQEKNSKSDDDDDSEPYIDKKVLSRRLQDFEKNLEKKIDQRAEEKARSLLGQQNKESWLKSNPDFYDVMNHADKFAQHDPDLAESILEMPDTFERQKLVYKNIKALGIHKPQPSEPSIQQKIDSNRKSPYYQPTGINSGPYAQQGDFSPAGRKNAYEQMQKLKSQLKI